MSMNFEFSAHQRELQLTARAFANTHLSGIRALLRPLTTPEARFEATRPAYVAAVEAGYLKAQIPSALGGTFTSLLDFTLIVEELMAVEASVPLSILSTGLGLMPLLFFGDPAQCRRFIPPFSRGTGAPLAAVSFSEPDGTANYHHPDPALGFQTSARLEGDEWVLSGKKIWTPHARGWGGSGADLLAVAARVDLTKPAQESLSIILIPGNSPGITVTESIETVGHPGAEVCIVHYDNVRAPRENLLGQVGDGIRIAETAFAATAGLVGIMAVGVARKAFDMALQFARNERRGGAVPIIAHQNVATILADMKAKIEAARYLSWKACDNFDRSRGQHQELSILSKVFCSELMLTVITDAMRVVGAEAYRESNGLAELLKDALAYPLFDGGNVGVRRLQLQRILAGADYDPMAAAEGQFTTS